MLQNFSRVERGFNWPAFWHIEDCRKNVRFHRSFLLDRRNYSQYVESPEETLRRRAFRYVFIPDCRAGEIELKVVHQFVNIPVRGSFSCGDGLLNRIWDASCETFRLCSGIFFYRRNKAGSPDMVRGCVPELYDQPVPDV